MKQKDLSQASKPSFGHDDYEIIKKEPVFQGFFRVSEYHIKHRLFAGGWSQPIVREIFDRGESAALLLYDPPLDNVILIEQFRTAAVGQAHVDSPWLLEIVAGMIDKGRDAKTVVIDEAKEEANCEIKEVFPVCRYLSSPGGTSELIHVFLGITDSSNAGGTYGLASENEDIKVHVVPRAEAYSWIASGRVVNGLTIVALQWLELNHNSMKFKK